MIKPSCRGGMASGVGGGWLAAALRVRWLSPVDARHVRRSAGHLRAGDRQGLPLTSGQGHRCGTRPWRSRGDRAKAPGRSARRQRFVSDELVTGADVADVNR